MDIKEIDSILMGKCVFHRFEQEYGFSKKRKTNKQKKKTSLVPHYSWR